MDGKLNSKHYSGIYEEKIGITEKVIEMEKTRGNSGLYRDQR